MESDEIKTEHGLVAILDALGASQFGNKEVAHYLNAREQVLLLLNKKTKDIFGDSIGSKITKTQISVFTFNDTILITFRSGKQLPTLKQICGFLLIIRKFVVDSLYHGILFRGAIGAGGFHMSLAQQRP